MAVVDGCERGDGIDEQQRRMAGGVERTAHRADAARHPGGCLVVHDSDRLDRVVAVLCKPRLDARRVRAGAPVAFEDLDLQAEPARHRRPERRKVPGLAHQHRIAGRERVDERRLPRAGARRRKDQHVAARPENVAQARQHAASEPPELGSAVVHRRALDRAQDPIRNVGRARNLQEVPAGVPAVRSAHDSNSPESRCAASPIASRSVRRGAGWSYSGALGRGARSLPSFHGKANERTILLEKTIPKETFVDGCLLCSEDQPHHCHRRLVAEYLNDRWGGVEIAHLG